MAKVTMPLMSGDARGGFGGVLVFSGWKGRSVVRKLVIPANPQSAGQQDSRNAIRVVGAAQRFSNACLLTGAGRLETDEQLIRAITPSGQAWNGYLVKMAIGQQQVNYTAAEVAWAALAAGEKTAWNVAAAGLTPVIPDVVQVDAGGIAGTSITAGQVFFTYQYALFKMDIAAMPGAVPPVYA